MSKTASRKGLLQACIQDLHAGRVIAAERLPCIAKEAGPALALPVRELRQAYAGEAAEMERLGFDLDGPENLWMTGILDDAERDTRSIEPGPLLDCALIGAVRKAVAADSVSLETAERVALALGERLCAEAVSAMRERSRECDAALRDLLHRLA